MKTGSDSLKKGKATYAKLFPAGTRDSGKRKSVATRKRNLDSDPECAGQSAKS